MGCCPCFDAKDVVELGGAPNGRSEQRREEQPIMMVAPQVNRLASGSDRPRTRSSVTSKKETTELPTEDSGVKISAQTFTYRQLAAATNNFRSESFIGEGGFGKVYKGRLEKTGQIVAVKQLDRNGLQGNREFLVEVLMLSLLDHPNLVKLIGYCAEGDQRLLVYEYMPLGSLEDRLHDLPSDKEPLDWTTRMKIAAGAAKGLEYLHNKANPPVIYRDFKPSNILLGEGYEPKLSDFGLAKLGPIGDKSHVSTRVMGTYGYCAPEYAMTGQLTVMSDVYSFGVVLLELITGRRAIDGTRPHTEQNLVAWARPLLNSSDKRRFMRLVDPALRGQCLPRMLYQGLAISALCIQDQAAKRPATADIVTALAYLASQKYDPNSAVPDCISRGARQPDTSRGHSRQDEDGKPTTTKAKEDGVTGNEDSLEARVELMNKRNLDRERAVAEAKQWGENWRRSHARGDYDGPGTYG